MMFRLAHISDVHLGPLPSVAPHLLLSKRVTGYVNWHRNRSRAMGAGVLDALIADLLAQGPDHVAVTGDLTNLALADEIGRAADWLRRLGPPERVSVVPGNHDAYVPGALAAATRAWAAHMTGERVGGAAYPYLRRAGEIALVGCSTAEATAPFMANGPFRRAQADRLGRLLERAGGEGRFRVVLIHHPPVRGAAGALSRMLGLGAFGACIADAGAELILHGHTHLPTLHELPTPRGPVPVLGVAAAGQAPGGHRPAARFNLLEIGRHGAGWRCERIERGIAPDGATMREIGRERLNPPAG